MEMKTRTRTDPKEEEKHGADADEGTVLVTMRGCVKVVCLLS